MAVVIDAHYFHASDEYYEAFEEWLKEPAQSWIYEDHHEYDSDFRKSARYAKALIVYFEKEINDLKRAIAEGRIV